MGEPIVLSREGFVDAIVEVFVMREYDVATNIVELRICQSWPDRGKS